MTQLDSPQPVMYAAPRRGASLGAWIARLILLSILSVILLLVILVGAVAAFQGQYAGRYFPGVTIMGVDVGGMSPDEARAALNDDFAYTENAVFTLRAGDRFWQLDAGELGVSLAVDAMLDEAAAVGGSGSLLHDLGAQSDAWFNGYHVRPVLTYDEAAAAAHLQAIAAEIDQPPQNASLTFDGATVQHTPGQTGRALDIPATLALLREQIMRLDTGGEIPLVIVETAPRIRDAAETAARIETALSGPLTLVATDRDGSMLGPWTASPQQIASLLQVEMVDGGDGAQRYSVSVDLSAFEVSLASLAPGLITSPVNGRFHFNEATGQLEQVRPSASGRTLNVAETLAQLEAAVFSPDQRTVPMAFDYTLPDYHDRVSAAELGITEMVAESTTFFTGSEPNRRANIAVSASRFDGLIIPPGGEFSFNYFLGPISEETGFVEGKVIFGGRTIAGIGGGVCQVSTTVFRAAFEGGFAITERNSHGYRVGYYELGNQPPGLDAAIWQPERDFRFLNNTPHHLLIETAIYPDRDALQFRFYSTRHWDTIIEEAIIKERVPPPPNRFIANPDLNPGDIVQVDYAAEGADVTVYREIYDPSGALVREDYVFTHYLPWQAVFEVPPGDSRLG